MLIKNNYPKGSEWRKCDLHVHTPLDHEWINKPDLSSKESKKNFAKEFVEFAISEQLELIAITDHNFCNSIENLVIPFIIEAAIGKPLTVLPGFEITVKDGSGIHLLVIFPEGTEMKAILEVVNRLFPIGTILMPSSGVVPVSDKGLDELKQILDGSKLQYLLVFAHADRDNGVLNPKTITGTRRVQEWKKDYVNICQLSKAKASFGKGFISSVIDKTSGYYDRDITYIVASDCRTLSKAVSEEGRHYLGQKFTWIKANPSFEGLRQILFESETRVRVQDDKPEQKRTHLVIDKVKFVSEISDKTFSQKYIEVNPNLNAIIGGKSSGKSLLLYYIAKTIDPKQLVEKFSELSGTDVYSFEKDTPKFDFEVVWGDGHCNRLTDSEEKKARQITYIPQMYINHLAERGNDELKRLIEAILEEKPEFRQFHLDAKQEISGFRGLITNSIFNYFEQKRQLVEIQNQIKGKGDKIARKNNLKIRKDELAFLRIESGFTAEQEADYLRKLNRVEIQTSRKLTLENIHKAFSTKYTEELKRIETLINKEFDVLQEATLTNVITKSVHNTIRENTNEYKGKILSQFQTIRDDINAKTLRIEIWLKATEEKITSYNALLEPYIAKITKKEKLDEIQIDINNEEKILGEIDQLEQKELAALRQLSKYKNEIINNYALMIEKYVKIIDEVNNKYSEISEEKDIRLKAILSFASAEFTDSCTKGIAKRSALSSFGNYFNYNDFVFVEKTHLESITDFFEQILTKDIKYNVGGSQTIVCEKMFDDYFFIDYEIFQKGDSIFKMSPGKKGLILLYLILHLSNASYPILIDQPEDNLDNRTVYRELKDFMKTKKIERQILIVTHNANLVVPTDAENVIVANQSGQDNGKDNEIYKFEYSSGALELSFIDPTGVGVLNQMGIREHVCEILEGGEAAFKEREIRYSIS